MSAAEWATIAPIAVLAAVALGLFEVGTVRLGRSEEESSAGTIRAARQRDAQAWLYRCGIVVAVAVVLPPLGGWGQHNLFARSMVDSAMAFFVPPLVLFGAPWPALSAAVGVDTRTGRSGVREPWVRGDRLWTVLGHPLASTAALAVVIGVWQVPAVVDATTGVPGLCDVEFLSFLVAGVLFWRQLVGSYPHEPAWAPLERSWLVVVVLAEISVIGASLVFSARPWYPAFTPAHGSLLAGTLDQGMAGAIMWSIPAMALGAVAIWCYVEWLRHDENDDLELHRIMRQTMAATGSLRRAFAAGHTLHTPDTGGGDR